MSIFPDDRSICRCWESHEITREKMVFLRKCQYSRQSACSTHSTFPARIHRWPSRECGEVFYCPLSGLCHHIDSCHIFPAPFNKKTTQTTGQQYCYCCFYSDPHNGSRFSNSEFFIEATRPDAIVFSSGYLNPMKHPHSETLNLYKNSGVKIYRTDLNGALQIISNSQKYAIHTHEGL